eukprot:4738873-Karenia_brevis.AAC.1
MMVLDVLGAGTQSQIKSRYFTHSLRQYCAKSFIPGPQEKSREACREQHQCAWGAPWNETSRAAQKGVRVAVSYTHLTLPTICSV